MMNRRDFVKSGLGMAIGLTGYNAFAKERMIKNIGVQLYTVRDQMEISVPRTLAKIAEIGFKETEFVGYFSHSAQEIKKLLDQNGLTAPSAHISLTEARDNIEALVEYSKIVGHKYLSIGWLEPEERSTLDDYKKCIEVFNRADEVCKSAGMRFGYHHYDFEFNEIDGIVPYDMILEQSDVIMQADLHWIAKAGVDMEKYYAKYPGRFPICHVKDIDDDGNYEDVGKGNIDFPDMLKSRDLAGFKHYFIEHGTPKNSMRTIVTGYEYTKKL